MYIYIYLYVLTADKRRNNEKKINDDEGKETVEKRKRNERLCRNIKRGKKK